MASGTRTIERLFTSVSCASLSCGLPFHYWVGRTTLRRAEFQPADLVALTALPLDLPARQRHDRRKCGGCLLLLLPAKRLFSIKWRGRHYLRGSLDPLPESSCCKSSRSRECETHPCACVASKAWAAAAKRESKPAAASSPGICNTNCCDGLIILSIPGHIDRGTLPRSESDVQTKKVRLNARLRLLQLQRTSQLFEHIGLSSNQTLCNPHAV